MRRELLTNGLSLTHVDFMIGSKQLNIDGFTTDGQIDLFTTRVTRQFKQFVPSILF